MVYAAQPTSEESLTIIQKYVLLRAHPRRLFLDAAALIWEVYFLWNQNWKAALGVFLAMNTVGLLAVRKINYQEFAKTTLGKMALLHLHPMNLTIQLVGATLSIYGIWWHDTLTVLTGITLLYVGHFYGWSRVHPSLKMKERSA